MDWVYPIYLLLHDSLADDIKEKVAGAQTGDLLDLVAINIAIRHFEMFPTALEIAFCKMSMGEDGANDVMQFLTRLKAVRTRLRLAIYSPMKKL